MTFCHYREGMAWTTLQQELMMRAGIHRGLRRNRNQSCGGWEQDAAIWQVELKVRCESVRDLTQQERPKPGTFPRHMLLLKSSIDGGKELGL